MRILITGALGSLGLRLLERFDVKRLGERICYSGCETFLPTDRYDLDVRDIDAVRAQCEWWKPDLIYHLAAAKHAPEGELDPWGVAETNIIGTRNILATGVRTILASTCKAADPETVYGASKLIAERMTLAAGGSVARFYNVRETCGNVFETWRGIPEDEPLPVTDCFRRFVSLERAVDLLVWLKDAEPGRYTLWPEAGRWMREEADRFAPGREQRMIPRRRGDRKVEPLHARCERLEPCGDGIARVICDHDPVRERVAA